MASTTNNVDLSVKSENIDYVRFVKGTANPTTNKTDWDVRVLSSPSEVVEKDMIAKGYTRQATQTVRISRAGTPEGFEQLISDPEERVNVFNRGVSQKLTQKLSALFSDSNEDGSPTHAYTEDVFDPSELLNDPTSRRNLSPEEKAIRDLRKSGLPEQVIQAMLSAMRSN